MMSIMLVSATLFLCIGLYSSTKPRLGTYTFLLYFFLFPTSNLYQEFNLWSGIFVADFYFLGLLPHLLIRPRLYSNFYRGNGLELTTIFGIAFIYFLVTALAATPHVDKYLIKDLRPFVLTLELLLITPLVTDLRLSLRHVSWLTLGAAISCCVFFGLARFGLYLPDRLINEENTYRYLAGGSYLAALYIAVTTATIRNFPSHGSRLKLFAIFASATALALSTARTLEFATILVLGAFYIRSMRRLFEYVIIGTLIAALFFSASQYTPVERLASGYAISGIADQLANRFGPGFGVIQAMNETEIFLGRGPGTTFEIPWFQYVGLDVESETVDSAYITFYSKYGVLGLLYLLWFAAFWGRKQSLFRWHQLYLVVFVLIIYSTSAILYQGYGIGLFLAVIILNGVLARRSKTKPNPVTAIDVGSATYPARRHIDRPLTFLLRAPSSSRVITTPARWSGI